MMIAAASRQKRQMSALRTRIEISNDRRPHGVVLHAVPEATLIPPSRGGQFVSTRA